MAWELWVGGYFGGSWCWLSEGIKGIIVAAVGGGCATVSLGSVSMWWSLQGGCVLLHLSMGCISLGLGVAIGVMVFGLASVLLASFLIMGMSWVGGGVFVFSLEFFMGTGHLLSSQLLHWWGSLGPDLVWLFRGFSGNSLEGNVA